MPQSTAHEVSFHPQAPPTSLLAPSSLTTGKRTSRLPADFPFHLPRRPYLNEAGAPGLRLASISLSRHYHGPRLHSAVSNGAITLSLCSPPACTSSRATNVCSQPRQQTAAIRPPSPKSRPDKPGARVWGHQPPAQEVLLPPTPLVFGGTVSASPAPQGLWTEASPDLGVGPPAHSQPGPTSRSGPRPGPCC